MIDFQSLPAEQDRPQPQRWRIQEADAWKQLDHLQEFFELQLFLKQWAAEKRYILGAAKKWMVLVNKNLRLSKFKSKFTLV